MKIEFIKEVKPKRKPKDRPSAVLDKIFLVTAHYGSRICVLYHGDSQQMAYEILSLGAGPRPEHRKKCLRKVTKMWTLVRGERESF